MQLDGPALGIDHRSAVRPHLADAKAMTAAGLREWLQGLYFGEHGRARRFRYGLIALDLVFAVLLSDRARRSCPPRVEIGRAVTSACCSSSSLVWTGGATASLWGMSVHK